MDIRANEARLRVLYGSLTIKSITLELAGDGNTVAVQLEKTPVPCRRSGHAIHFETEITISAGKTLRVEAEILVETRNSTGAP